MEESTTCFSQSNPVLVVSIYFTLEVQATMPGVWKCNSSKTQAKKLFVAEPEFNVYGSIFSFAKYYLNMKINFERLKL